MTGRGAGLCAGSAGPAGFAGGFGCGNGRGRGFGFGRMANAPGRGRGAFPAYGEAAGEEKSFLSERADFLEKQLEQVKARLARLEEEGE